MQQYGLAITPLKCTNVLENRDCLYLSVTATNIKVITLTDQSYSYNYTILLQ